MKNFLLLFVMIVTMCFAFVTHAQFTDPQNSNMHIVNEWKNGGGEYGKVNWSETGSGTLSTDTTTKLRGKASIKFVSAGNGDYVASAGVSCKQGPNCLVRFYYKTTGTSWTAYIYDGSSNLIQTLVLPANTEFSKAELSFIAATPTTLYSLRVVDGSAGSDTVYIDSGSLAANDNVGSVAQAEFVGKISFGSNCAWARTSNSYADYTGDAACTTTIVGNVTTVSDGTGIQPAIKVLYPKIGTYQVRGNMAPLDSTADGESYSRFFDGTNDFGSNYNYLSIAQQNALGTHIGSYTYTTPLNPLSIQYQRRSGGGLATNAGNRDGFIEVYYFPSAAEQVVRAENANVFGALEWLNISSCAFTASAGSILSDTDCNTATRKIGNIYYGADDTLQLISPSLKAGGIYRAIIYGGSSSTGNLAITDGTNDYMCTYLSGTVGTTCIAYFNYSSFQATKTFSAKCLSGTCTMYADGATTQVGISIEEVYPTQAMPQIVNSVGHDYDGQVRLIYGHASGAAQNTVCSSTPCTTTFRSGVGFSSVSRSGTGTYTINVASGKCSDSITCTIGQYMATNYAVCNPQASTTTTANVLCENLSGTAFDEAFTFNCFCKK
jgi:hypothetical protein